MATQLPPDLLAAFQSQRTTPEQRALLGQYLGVDLGNGSLGTSDPNSLSGLDTAMYLSRRGPTEGGSAGAQQRFSSLIDPFRGQEVQYRPESVDVGEGQVQNFWSMLNPVTNQWERSNEQISNGTEGYSLYDLPNMRPDAQREANLGSRSGGILGGPTGTHNTSLIPGTQYAVGPDGKVTLRDVVGSTPQNHITGQENLMGVLAVLGGAAAGIGFGGASLGGGLSEAGSLGAGGVGSTWGAGAAGAGAGGAGSAAAGAAGAAGGAGSLGVEVGGPMSTGLPTATNLGALPAAATPAAGTTAGLLGNGGGTLSQLSTLAQNPLVRAGVGAAMSSLGSGGSGGSGGGNGLAGLLGAALGGAAGAQGQQGSMTNQNRMDPRFDPYLFGDGGYLPTVHNVFQQQMAQGGMNDRQRTALDNQWSFFTNPANAAGYQNISNVGQGLLGRGVAANPYNRG